MIMFERVGEIAAKVDCQIRCERVKKLGPG